MKKIYFLFLFCVFGQILSAQTKIQNQDTGNTYALAVDINGGTNCGGTGRCLRGEETLQVGEQYPAFGILSFDKHGRVMLELEKNRLSNAIQYDIDKDGFLTIPFGLQIPEFILIDRNSIEALGRIPAGNYLAIDKGDKILIVLGKLN